MPVDSIGNVEDRKKFSHLEALGRTLCGMAPWIENPCDNLNEESSRQSYAGLARRAIDSAVDPKSPDYMNFTGQFGDQPLVDGAFLAHAILRAPQELFYKLPQQTKTNLTAAFKSLRGCTAHFCNWLLFAGMVETALCLMGEDYDHMRIDYSIRQHEQWYKGDGMYGDGPAFHADYYNSFVLQPMLADIVTFMNRQTNARWAEFENRVLKRAARYAQILERLIMPDGTFPVVGRSMCYRFGCFQHLSQMCLQHNLPEALSPAAVRCALTAVIRRIAENPAMFDENGWLTVGFYGYQPNISEHYISSGSLYLCSTVFLPLGLPESDPFWSGADEAWTSVKIWSGENVFADHSISD